VRVRRYALPLLVALSVALVACLASGAGAQIAQPDITGHGCCYQAPGCEPSLSSFTVDFDGFLRERSAQIRAAAAHWLPLRGGLVLSYSRPAPVSRAVR
jgi:hypothetical protein